jgi:Holliday junction resolvase RusA-like endonuclease
VVRGHAYTPKTTVDYENLIRAEWDAELRPDMPACVRLVVRFYLGTHRRADVDNMLKSVKDALNQRAYDDDWRVYDVRSEKWHTSKDRARTEITVYAIDADREERA